MSRYIDADIATKLMIQWADRETNDDIRHGYHNCQVIMNDMPDAAVQCKDCTMFERNGRKGFGNCAHHQCLAYLSDFCSWGIKRGDAE